MFFSLNLLNVISGSRFHLPLKDFQYDSSSMLGFSTAPSLAMSACKETEAQVSVAINCFLSCCYQQASATEETNRL